MSIEQRRMDYVSHVVLMRLGITGHEQFHSGVRAYSPVYYCKECISISSAG